MAAEMMMAKSLLLDLRVIYQSVNLDLFGQGGHRCETELLLVFSARN